MTVEHNLLAQLEIDGKALVANQGANVRLQGRIAELYSIEKSKASQADEPVRINISDIS